MLNSVSDWYVNTQYIRQLIGWPVLWQACIVSLSHFISLSPALLFSCPLPLYWPCSVFCQSPSSPPSLSSPSFSFMSPFLCLPPPSFSSIIARSYKDSDHRGNLWEESGLVFGRIAVREGKWETERYTGATVCEGEREGAACFVQDTIRWLVCELWRSRGQLSGVLIPSALGWSVFLQVSGTPPCGKIRLP